MLFLNTYARMYGYINSITSSKIDIIRAGGTVIMVCQQIGNLGEGDEMNLYYCCYCSIKTDKQKRIGITEETN